MNLKAEIRFIGVVTKADEEKAELHIFPEFCAGLKDITDFSHLIILYWMHLRDTQKHRQALLVIPKRHYVSAETGVFSCRSPSRPNPIGLCVVELLTIRNCTLTVKGLDAEKGSQIIDIKPYLPKADSIPNARAPEWTSHGPST